MTVELSLITCLYEHIRR